MQFYKQDEPHQFVGWRVETTAMQIYAARHCMQPAKKPASRWQQMNGWKWWGCSAPNKKAGTHLLFAYTACCKNWFEGSHSRRHQCHVALSCFPKRYPLSHQLEVRDTEPHTVCPHQQTCMVIGRHHMWQPNWDTCLYRLGHRERQSREAGCPEAHEKGHNLPGDV